MAEQGDGKPIVVGRIAGLYGVRGWVKVFSHTQPRENILGYKPWLLQIGGRWVEASAAEGRMHGKGVVAHLEGYDDRDVAAALVGCDIAVHREQLAPVEDDEIYWADLIGLKVVTREGVELGNVDHLIETGANDVVVVRGERERLLPYIDGVVLEVDLDQGVMEVDWDPEF